jgi:hypothetical protein
MSDLLEAIAAEFAELRRQAAAERSANAVGDESEDPDLEDVLEAADRHCAAALIEPGPCVGCIEAKRCAHELLACATFTDFVNRGAGADRWLEAPRAPTRSIFRTIFPMGRRHQN